MMHRNDKHLTDDHLTDEHLTDDQLTLVYYGEADAATGSHAQSCEACHRRYTALTEFMDAVRNAPAGDPGPHLEQRVWTAIGARVTETVERRRPRLSRFWLLGPGLAGSFAAVFFAGMFIQNRVDRAHPESFSPKSRERVLLITMGDHLDRSQIVLAELANAPESGKTDISAEQQLASRLLGENRLLRQAAQHSGDTNDANLLDQLERVLIDVANSPAEVSGSDLKDLQDRIAAQGLLFKVRVVSAADREKGMKL
jgi:hypothetical protein